MDSHKFEAILIGNDACSLKDLALSVSKQEFSGVLGLGFLPFVCFFAVESYDWLRDQNIASLNPFLEAEATRIRSLRARLKLFGGRGGFDTVLERLQEVEKVSMRIFHSKHHDSLSWITRLLQDDLGFYFHESDLICTTHVGFANIGYFDQELQIMTEIDSKEIFQFSVNLGDFLAHVLSLMNIECPKNASSKANVMVTAEDYKAEIVYPLINERLGFIHLPLAASFTWLVSQVNYVHIVLRHFFESENDLFLRYKFLTAFYAVHALQTVGALIKGDRTTEIGRMVSEIMVRPNSALPPIEIGVYEAEVC